MNTITIELCAEDRARLDRIAQLLEDKQCEKCVQAAYDYTQHLTGKDEAPDTSTETPQTAPEAQNGESVNPTEEMRTQPGTSEASATPAVTVEDIRSKVLELSGAGKRDAVRDIVKEYATKVSDIPADKLAEVYARLCALEG